jgi:energy-coupling factor transport system ATP-binding protein
MDALIGEPGPPAIGHLCDREPLALSGGEQRQVAIASIVAMGTSVLVLDEPTAQLDPAGTASVADLLGELANGGTSILCVEHDPNMLGQMDRCLVLDAGRAIVLDVPGAALADAEAATGIAPPTMVHLARAASIGLSSAFDEEAVAAGLLARAASPEPALTDSATAGRLAPSEHADWAPARDRRPVRVAIDGLVHRYPTGIEALRGVSLVIEPGETLRSSVRTARANDAGQAPQRPPSPSVGSRAARRRSHGRPHHRAARDDRRVRLPEPR